MINLIGQTFGHWTVTAPALPARNREARWLCRCACGTERIVSSYKLRTGESQSCRCRMGTVNESLRLTHGHARHDGTRSRAYKAWAAMIGRCAGDPVGRLAHWAGRGIIVCERWRTDFTAFLADMGEPPTGHRVSLDRINNDGNYEPSNVRWAAPQDQARNRSNNKLDIARATEIYRRVAAGSRSTDVAIDFGVSRALVRAIVSGKTWPEAAMVAAAAPDILRQELRSEPT